MLKALDNMDAFFYRIQTPSTIWWACSLWVIIAAAGAILEYSYLSLIISATVILLGISYLPFLQQGNSRIGVITTIGWLVAITYATVFAAFTPHINSCRSSREILEMLVKYEVGNASNISVGMYVHNSFSSFWVANAWATNPGKRPVSVTYLQPGSIMQSHVTHYLIKGATRQTIPPEVLANFRLIRQKSGWLLFKRKTAFRNYTPDMRRQNAG